MTFIFYFIISIIPTTLLILHFYSRSLGRKPRVHAKHGSKWAKFIKKNMSVLEETFHPCWWCPWGIPQTLFRVLFRSLPKLPFKREIVELDDGGCLAIDWLHSEGENEETPMMLMLPGMTSSTHDCAYILYSAQIANQKGYRVVVMNPRGLGGVPLKTARTYNPAKTDDLETVVKLINERYPKSKKLACGYSLGGMSLWNYLCSQEKTTVGFSAAILISSPWDPIEASFVNERFIPRILFNKFLAGVLRDYIKPYKHLFEDKLDWEQAMNLKSVRDYDRYVTVPVFGYEDWADYYHQASLYHKHKLHGIPIPTLCLNAKDDCFSPLTSIPFHEVKKTSNVVSVTTRHGGHLAFMKHANPSAIGYDEEVLDQYSDLVFSKEFEKLMM